jgi:DNA-binding HxlR family transcriptional regulator
MKTYGQFCPVAKASEVFAERWTPLIMRELLMGARRFSDIQAGVPLMSRTTLAQRLRELVDGGIIATVPRKGARGHDYVLTPAGDAARSVITELSLWGQRWGQGRISPKDIDAEQLMWGMRRHIDPSALHRNRRVVVRFEFSGMPGARISRRSWWLIIGPDDIDVCFKNPGHAVDIVVIADLGAFTRVWLGYIGLAEIGDKVRFDGSPDKIAWLQRLLNLPDRPRQRPFKYEPIGEASSPGLA